MTHMMRKPVFVVSEQVILKLASNKASGLEFFTLKTGFVNLSEESTTKALNRACVVRSLDRLMNKPSG